MPKVYRAIDTGHSAGVIKISDPRDGYKLAPNVKGPDGKQAVRRSTAKN